MWRVLSVERWRLSAERGRSSHSPDLHEAPVALSGAWRFTSRELNVNLPDVASVGRKAPVRLRNNIGRKCNIIVWGGYLDGMILVRDLFYTRKPSLSVRGRK